MGKTVKIVSESYCKELSLKETCDFLRENDNFLFLCHASPDGDTLGSAFALAIALSKEGKKCAVKCADKIPEKYSYFTDAVTFPDFKAEKIIAVDTASMALLGSCAEEYLGKIDLCIDHHISNTRFADRLYLDSDAAANCQCIYEIIREYPLEMDDTIAAALYTGISTDTGSFKYSNVTAKTHLITAELYSYDIHADEIGRIMFDTKSRGRLELEKMVLAGAEFHFGGKCMLLTATNEMKEMTGCSDNDLEGVASISRSVEGVICGVSIKQKEDDSYKISLRTYEPLNASEICQRLGGGGHKGAAGCTLCGSLEEVKKQILDTLKDFLED